MTINDGILAIGGCSVQQLAEKFQTPLYVIDQADLKARIQLFLDHFQSKTLSTHIIYASKTFMNLYIAGLVHEMNLYADAVSGGEIYTLLKGGVNPSKIYFHGNNKSEYEISYAIEKGVGTFVVDNDDEFDRIQKIATEKNKTARILLRVNPGIEAETHKYIQTTKEDSKFGMNTTDPRTQDFVKKANQTSHIHFAGIHCHIGSQVMKPKFFFEEAEAMIKFARTLEETCGVEIEEINLGGGFGVYYTEEDQPFEYDEFLKQYIERVESLILTYHLHHVKTISIEPGRSIINDSGSMLYRVGGVKHPTAGLPFIFVDGGMSDNPRPALYEAKYEAAIANKMGKPIHENYRVAGKLCETGDVLIQSVALPKAEVGDLLVIPRSGAYTYSMSSNYNRVERPAVVFVEDGEAHLAVKRETYEDLTRNDLPYN